MTLRCWFYFSWNLRCEALEVNCMLHVLDGSSMLHDRIKENKDNTAQWPTEPGQVTFACFVCCVKKVRARSSENLLVLTCVCLQVYSSASPLRLGPQRVGLAFASDAASGCKPEFSHFLCSWYQSRRCFLAHLWMSICRVHTGSNRSIRGLRSLRRYLKGASTKVP